MTPSDFTGSDMDGPTFNLVDEAWVPVVENGKPSLLSLLDVLTRADKIDALGTANPLEAVAVLRQVLLPVYLDACGAPDSEQAWLRRWRETSLPGGALKAYLIEHRSRFDLFGARPFGQVAALRTAKSETKPVSLLLAAVASGNNVPLFAARTEADPPALTPAEAARAMLATQCWDTAAIKSGAADDPQAAKGGKTTGNPTGPCGALGVIVPVGRTLAETLLLNTPIVRQPPEEDVPQWRRPGTPSGVWQQRPALGRLDLLTWQSRRVRLVPEIDSSGRIVVRRVVLTAGDRLDRIPQDVEPHTAWRQVDKPKAGQPPVAPLRHVAGRQAWRGLSAMLPVRGQSGTKSFSSALLDQLDTLCGQAPALEDLPLQVLTVGVVYGNQSAVVEDVMSDLVPLPVAALSPDSDARRLVDTVVGHAELLRQAANRLADDLRRASGGDALPWDRGLRLGDALMHEFSVVVRRMLVGLQHHPDRCDQAEDAWRVTARQLAYEVAEIVLSAAPPEAFRGREGADKKTYRLSSAEAWYRSAVRNILGTEN